MTEFIFGEQNIGDTEHSLATNIHGSPFQIPHSGLAKHMQVFLGLQARIFDFRVKCAIYHLNTGKSDNSGDLVAVSNERNIPSIQDWWEFDFSNELLLRNQWYALEVWSPDGSRTIFCLEGVFKGKKKTEAYNGFPDPISFSTIYRHYTIYCIYEAVAESYARVFSDGLVTL